MKTLSEKWRIFFKIKAKTHINIPTTKSGIAGDEINFFIKRI
jgi:hypothetical protein